MYEFWLKINKIHIIVHEICKILFTALHNQRMLVNNKKKKYGLFIKFVKSVEKYYVPIKDSQYLPYCMNQQGFEFSMFSLFFFLLTFIYRGYQVLTPLTI